MAQRAENPGEPFGDERGKRTGGVLHPVGRRGVTAIPRHGAFESAALHSAPQPGRRQHRSSANATWIKLSDASGTGASLPAHNGCQTPTARAMAGQNKTGARPIATQPAPSSSNRSAHRWTAFVRMQRRRGPWCAEEDHTTNFDKARQRQRTSDTKENRRRNRRPRRRAVRDGGIEQAEIDEPFADKAVERRQPRKSPPRRVRRAKPSRASPATGRRAGSFRACRWRAAPSRRRKTK